MEKLKQLIQKMEDFIKSKRKRTQKVNIYVNDVIDEIQKMYESVCKQDFLKLLNHDADYRVALTNCYKRLKNLDEFKYFTEILQLLCQILQVFLNSMAVMKERLEELKDKAKSAHDTTIQEVTRVTKTISEKLDNLSSSPLEEERVQAFALDSSCIGFDQGTSQWILIDSFEAFNAKTRKALARDWRVLSSTCWISKRFDPSILSQTMEIIPTRDYFEYFQVIGRSDIMPARLSSLPGLTERIIREGFYDRYWQEKLSYVLHFREDDWEENYEEIREIGDHLFEQKQYVQALWWFTKSNSTKMITKCREMIKDEGNQ